MKNFDKNQLIAALSNTDYSLTANAGSGKTTVLIEKFIDKLLNDKNVNFDLNKILLITFTIKAAKDMRKKLFDRINNLINTNDDPVFVRNLKKIRKNLYKAKISTINSFCKTLIDKYYGEIDLIPSIFDFSRPQIQNEIDNILKNFVLDNLNSNFNQINHLLSIEHIKSIINEFHRNNLYYNKFKSIYTNKNLVQDFENEILEMLNPFIEEYKFIVQIVRNQPEINKPKTNVDSQLNLINIDLLQLESSLKNGVTISELKISQILLIKLSGLNIETILKKYLEILPTEYVNRINNFIQLVEKVKTFNILKSDIEAIKVHQIIFEYYEDFRNLINEFKKENRIVDFDDQLIYANKILNIPNPKKEISDELNWILVDEFQDTSEIQVNIIKNLLNDSNNLFVVGDQKQSIYSFRDADVKTFRDLNKYIVQRNFEKSSHIIETSVQYDNRVLNKNSEELKGLGTLPISFRMNKYLASFVNFISKNLFNGVSEFDVPNTPIISGKGKFDTTTQPYISFLYSTDDVDESQTIFNKILDLINSGFALKDICILSRTKTNFPSISEKLNEVGIKNVFPASETLKDDFYISEIIDYLNYLAGDDDNYYQLSILKSSFFGLSDDQIFEIFSINPKKNLFENLKISNSQKYQEIFTKIETVKKYATSLNTFFLLNVMIQLSDWNKNIASNKKKSSILLNLKNLKEKVLELENKGFCSLKNILDLLNLETKEDSKNVNIADDAINMLTIHSSKGLEFKCVILAYCNNPQKNQDQFFMDEKYGLLKKSIITDKSYLHNKNKLINQEQSYNEEKRLLYVAITRAQEKLIISGHYKSNEKFSNDSYMNQIYRFFSNINIDITKNISENEFYNEFEFKNVIEIYENNQTRNEQIETIIRTDTNFEFDISFFKIDAINEDLRIIIDQKINNPVTFETLTATKLTYLSKDKNRFKSRYLLGIPEEKDYSQDLYLKPKLDNDEITGTEKGVYFHNIISNIKEFYINGELDFSIVEKFINLELKDIFDQEKKEEFYKYLNTFLSYVLETNFIKSNINNIQNLQTELQIKMPIGDKLNNILSGAIDAVYQNENGEFEIWDWKTNNISNQMDKIKVAEFYYFQVKFYAYLISFFNKEQKIIPARLLFVSLAGWEKVDSEWIVSYEFEREELIKFGDSLNDKFEIINDLHYQL